MMAENSHLISKMPERETGLPNTYEWPILSRIVAIPQVATSELVGLIRRCVPKADWQVLWMLAQGCSYGEIAACCGLTVESLKSRVCRIRGRIRESRVGRMLQAALY